MAGPEPAESFVRTARREQLVDCAIEVIAQVGYEQASTVLVAQRAGVSRGVLTYHFRNRADLIDQVVRTVYELGRRAVGPEVAAAETPRAALLAFVGGSVDFYAAYPSHMAALGEIFAAGRRAGAPDRPRLPAHTQEMDTLGQTLAAGQRAGQFRAFDVALMAATIRGALDVAVAQIIGGAPAPHIRAELLRTIDAATGREDA